MSKFLLSSHPKQQTPAMSPSHPHTVRGVAASPLMPQEDEDNDICPVCDGECTCANKPRPSLPPRQRFQLSPRKHPSLKIRLTIPPSMLGKRPATSSNSKSAGPTTSASAAGGGTYTISPRPSTSFSSQYGTVPKKRGRPPKSIPSSRQLGIKSNSDALSFYHPAQAARKRKPTSSKKTGTSRIPAKLKGKGTTVRKVSAAKRRRLESSESSSELSDIDDSHFHFNDHDDDARSIQFPTFVSASALSSSSDSDAISSSGFDTDSSMEAEEENFIVAEESRGAEKSRVRRELLGEEGQKRRNPHNNWVIRPRKRSVGASDVEMEIDSDATEDEEEEEEEEQEAEEDDEADELPVGSGYIGLATGWSEEDEESSFDADLFFANLTDSDDDDDHSCPPDENDERGEDGDQSDLDTMSLSDTALAGLIPPFAARPGKSSVRVDGGLGWADFEVTASLAETSASPSQESDNEDMETEEDEFEGDTTDEELVGEDHLPNERAMRLFNLPFSVSSINPMSTMSPSASPAPRNRRPFGSLGNLDSPKPADILSGRVFLDDLDNPDDFDDDMNAPSVSSRGTGTGPRTGSFIPGDTVRAVIDDTHASVPSPHPRVRGRRGKSASHFGRTSPRHLPSRPLSLPPISQPSFQLLSSSELTTSPELPAQTIDLDDVLDSAFLDSEPSEDQLSASPTEQSRKHLNLSRWGWGSDTPGSNADFGNALRNSPLSSMLWQDKDGVSPTRQAQPGLPIRARDGDRTPTNGSARNPPPPPHDIPTKSRKETKRERKMKQKNMGLGHERPPHQQHYFRQHHPNLKTRSSGSSQRTNFFNNSPPTTNL
ncbi:hypothetical protein MVEN_01019000 [Mycena venus]|uniref:Uncharacterized protein n=1 Tax=Mycena venus TaxID=2733690 RepID=A0A8H6YD63_9AGAR|nr:hypothetical protein MVEN_01019000 [Mycena venus]